MSAIADAATSVELHVGLVAGSLATGSVAITPRMRQVPVAVVTAATAAAVAWSLPGAGWPVAGLAGLAGAAAVHTRRCTLSLATVGVLALAVSTPSVSAGVFLVAAIVVAAPALVDVVAARGSAVAAALLAVSVAGIWVAVPDTEEILLVGGALALPLLVTIGGGLERLVVSWSVPVCAAAVGPVVWAAISGGRGRPGSMVGGVACLGLLVVEPAARRLAGPLDPACNPAILVVALLVAQVAVVAASARVAAGHVAVVPAALVSAGALLAGIGVVSLALIALRRR